MYPKVKNLKKENITRWDKVIAECEIARLTPKDVLLILLSSPRTMISIDGKKWTEVSLAYYMFKYKKRINTRRRLILRRERDVGHIERLKIKKKRSNLLEYFRNK